MSTSSAEDVRPVELSHRLGYLLKHAQLALAGLIGPALAPLGITGRDLAVLMVLAGDEPLSQQSAATRLRVDRTTMVALIDGLEQLALVKRAPDPTDRRKNVVELSAKGKRTLAKGIAASTRAEDEFLAALPAAARRQFVDSLRAVAT